MTGRRIPQIDVVRGFALLGLPMVNLRLTFGDDHYPSPSGLSSFIYDNLVYGHFLTIFCFLFGVSFALILQSAGERTTRPRVVLARRLVALFAVSMFQLVALDKNLQLAVYATLGLVVLLPLSFLPRRAQLTVGLLLLLASLPVIEVDPQNAGNPVKVLLEWSGLLVLGSSVVQWRLHHDLARRGRQLASLLTVAVALVITTTLVRPSTANMLGSAVAEVRLLSICATYVTVVLLLLRSRLGGALTAALAPIGRMALTCFLTQAAAAMVFAALVDVSGWSFGLVTFGITTAFVAVQAVVCTWWLRRFRYGPVEWLWRCATWLQLVPMRRSATAVGVLGN